MKIRIPRQEIRRILGGRYENLHREFLGIDISGRGVDPIDQNVYYVSYLDTTGWSMFSGLRISSSCSLVSSLCSRTSS